MLQTTQAKPSLAMPEERLYSGECPDSPALGVDAETRAHSRSCKTPSSWSKSMGYSLTPWGHQSFMEGPDSATSV